MAESLSGGGSQACRNTLMTDAIARTLLITDTTDRGSPFADLLQRFTRRNSTYRYVRYRLFVWDRGRVSLDAGGMS